jgi:hypothetical protein
MDLYARPAIYAQAYGYRQIAAECDFAVAAAEVLGRPAGSVVELAAGPAAHARELARRGLWAAAVDHHPAMIAYLAATAPEICAIQAELTAFVLPRAVDLALCPLGGLAYLLDDAAWLAALAATRAALVPGGLLVAELAPGDADRADVDRWTVTAGATTVEAVAGPSARVGLDLFEWSLTLTRRCGQAVETVRGVERQRAVGAAGAERLLRQAGFRQVRAFEGYQRARRYRGGGALVLTAQA